MTHQRSTTQPPAGLKADSTDTHPWQPGTRSVHVKEGGVAGCAGGAGGAFKARLGRVQDANRRGTTSIAPKSDTAQRQR